MLDEKVRRTIEQVKQFVSDKPDAWALPEPAARFLHSWILAAGAKRGLEIGTSYGWSGLWIGSALRANGGHLVTIDMEPRKSRLAEQHFTQAGLSEVIKPLTGNAADVIAGLPGPFDFVLNDADKAASRRYFDLLLPKLAPRAAFISDNAISHRESFDGFLEYVSSRGDFFCVTAPIGNGFHIAVRTA